MNEYLKLLPLPKHDRVDQPVGSRITGGAGRDRTDDLKLAKLPLSQLSYGPLFMTLKHRYAPPVLPYRLLTDARCAFLNCIRNLGLVTLKSMVGLGRLELPTSRLSSARSNQLSYRPCVYAQPEPKP